MDIRNLIMKPDKNVTVLDQAFVLNINASSLEFFQNEILVA